MFPVQDSFRLGGSRLLYCCWVFGLLWSAAGCSDDVVSVVEPATPRPAYAQLDLVQQLGLEVLPGPVPTYFSPGSRTRAEQLQARLRAADDFFRDRMKVSPAISLAVLDPTHWAAISPGPYGVPFVSNEYDLVVMPAVPELAVVTQIYSAARVALPASAAADLAELGITYDDAVLLVLDLIGFHEVGHVYNAALGYRNNNTARWLEELLATYTAYSYLDVAEPSSMTVWNALSEAILGFVQPRTLSLDDFNTQPLRLLGPDGYGWFQSQFNLRDATVVRQRPKAVWFHQLAAAGLNQDTRSIPTSELLRRMHGFMPSFTAWAENVGFEYQ
jgi:hypothetical protein